MANRSATEHKCLLQPSSGLSRPGRGQPRYSWSSLAHKLRLTLQTPQANTVSGPVQGQELKGLRVSPGIAAGSKSQDLGLFIHFRENPARGDPRAPGLPVPLGFRRFNQLDDPHFGMGAGCGEKRLRREGAAGGGEAAASSLALARIFSGVWYSLETNGDLKSTRY